MSRRVAVTNGQLLGLFWAKKGKKGPKGKQKKSSRPESLNLTGGLRRKIDAISQCRYPMKPRLAMHDAKGPQAQKYITRWSLARVPWTFLPLSTSRQNSNFDLSSCCPTSHLPSSPCSAFCPRTLGISAWQLTASQLTKMIALAVAELEKASKWQDPACQLMRETLAANAIHPHIRTTTVSLGCCGMTKKPNSSNPASYFQLQESYEAPRSGLCCGDHDCWWPRNRPFLISRRATSR